MTVQIHLLFTIITAIIGIAGYIGGRISSARDAGKVDGAVSSDIKYIKEITDKINNTLEKLDNIALRHAERIATLERGLNEVNLKINSLYDKTLITKN
jgi:hypothetical protein